MCALLTTGTSGGADMPVEALVEARSSLCHFDSTDPENT